MTSWEVFARSLNTGELFQVSVQADLVWRTRHLLWMCFQMSPVHDTLSLSGDYQSNLGNNFLSSNSNIRNAFVN